MKKGELKKRLNGKACRFSESGGKWVSMIQVKTVLDEAEADLPEISGNNFLYADGELKAVEWVKKWFGEVEP